MTKIPNLSSCLLQGENIASGQNPEGLFCLGVTLPE